MADDGVTDGDVVHRGADLVHPAGVLVAERQRQIGGHRWGEPPVADVHVGAAQPCPGDPHDHVVRTGDVGSGTSSSRGAWPYSCNRSAFMLDLPRNGLARGASPARVADG